MRAFDEAGQIGDDKGAAKFSAVATSAAIRIDYAEIWFEGCERIVGDFRTRGGNYGNQSGLAGVRETNETNIGQEFQFETKMALFTGETVFVFARGLMPGFGEILIAAATASTLRDQHSLSRDSQVGDGFPCLRIVSERTDGNKQDHVRAGMAGAVRAFAVAAAIGFEFAIVAVAKKSVVVGIRFEINAAAMPAVASGGAAAGNIFLAAKSDTTIAAAAGLHEDFCFVNEHENHAPGER